MGPIAQSVEQRTFNPWVDGSSPSGPTVEILKRIKLLGFILTSPTVFSNRMLQATYLEQNDQANHMDLLLMMDKKPLM